MLVLFEEAKLSGADSTAAEALDDIDCRRFTGNPEIILGQKSASGKLDMPIWIRGQ
jgi:hypothetical protein